MERGKRGWQYLSCLGQNLPEDLYLRFHFMKYSVSASHSSCEWQRLAFRDISFYVPILGPGLSVHPPSWCYSVTVSLPFAPLSLHLCPQSSFSVSVLPHLMSSSLPDTVAPAQKVKILPFRSTPGTWACVLLFCFALQSAMCLSRENTQDCGDRTPCAEEPDGPGCPEGRGWGCIWARGVGGKVEEWGKKNSSEGCWLWETPGLGRGSEDP